MIYFCGWGFKHVQTTRLAFWRPRFKFMSARDLTQTLYDKDVDKGGGDIFLDMKELVLNDQDAPNKAPERKVRIEVFDSDFACFLDFMMLINATGWGFQWFFSFS